MPPLQALVALHGLRALALLPVAIWAIRQWPLRRLGVVGSVLSIGGLLALAIVCGRELLSWYPSVRPEQQKYLAARLLYVLGTNPDLPLVQILLAGSALWFAAWRRRRGISCSARTPQE